MANIMKPNDLAVRGVEKWSAKTTKVEQADWKASSVSLRLREHTLRAKSEFLRLHDS
jgi:hypothetical protein